MKTSSATKYISVWLVALTFYLSAWSEAGCTEEQSRALLGIRNSTNGSAFADFDGKDCCSAIGDLLWTSHPPSSYNVIDDLEEHTLAFCQLKQLKHLRLIDLGDNKLEGIIVSCLGLIQSLEELHLGSNHFQGDIPSSIFSAQGKIETFDVSDNQLEGDLSFSIFANASTLTFLNLSSNRFHGNLPSSIFSNSSKISLFDVSSNRLGGLLSFSIFANASSLNYLDLSNNELEVETESPSWVPSFSLNYLNLESCNLNKKTGHIVPSFISTQHDLALLDLSHNSLEGSIPCQLLFNMTSITALFLRSNEIKGSFPNCSANGSPSLEMFDISDNHINGSLPKDIGGLLPFLEVVNMSSNLLGGNIPWSIGDLPLKILDLSKNKLSGTIPSSLTTNESPLEYLNLSEEIALEVACHEECVEWKDCKFLIFLITVFQELLSLNLSNNFLTGSIPISFRDLKSIESLDLSQNGLTGKIPSELVGLTSLSVFSVAYNKLSGRIPFEQQFPTFPVQSFEGNLKLCGDPLPRKCSATDQPVRKDKSHRIDEKEGN
ncbi:LRR receptor-like serine/threonine-protein kinase ERECTA [Morella rubra]|uniref:LRR receptor-like serine/threonine-protein kinase ERECTA n=1 Tax=Morella rubra TaxID=262757 RepID=A0A6A1V1T5_9ROSI|nr:LRR receptor-like serine/threonine-protein kinase ERECTA [Morella rubra]